MRLAWLTDIHLNFLNTTEIERFFQSLKSARPDALLITGDIGEADSLSGHLRLMSAGVTCPIYLVLGNHDFYRGTIAAVRDDLRKLSNEINRIVYLTVNGIQELTPDCCLIGHDGWPDGRNGDYENSGILLNDFLLIRDFRRPDQTIPRLDPEVKRHWLTVMQRLADEAISHLEPLIAEAAKNFSRLILATHVPPFKDSSLFNGRVSRDDYQPFFSSQSMGEMLLRAAANHPNLNITVLCGHSHWPATYQPLPNLTVHTGGAEYGEPVIQKIWTI